jgi:ABC-type branched-subunit amino acid transport system substrate-binding protein
MSTPRHGRGRAWLPAVVLAALVTGCGTTVPLQSSGQTVSDGLGGLQPGASPTAGSTTGGALTPGTASTGAAAGPGTSGTSGQGLPVTSQPGQPGSAPGGKLPPIQIGSYYLEGASTALAAQGFAGLVIPDNKPLFDAMVKYLNAHGGLGGRQIQTVWFKYVNGGDPSTQDAAACQQFTEDHHVYVVIGGISSGAGLLGPCLTRHGVPLIGANAGGDSRYFAQNHRFIYEPGQASFTRGLSALVSSLQTNGWFTGTHKIGVVQYEGATYDHAVDDGLVASLGRLGLKVFDRVKYSGADNNSIAQGSASAVLKFNTEHIDRVIFMGPGGAAANDFMSAASTQHYYPLYGVWSADSPYILGILSPPDQLANATGIGYQPGLDVASTQDPTATTPTGKACLKFWDSVGQTDHSALNNPLQRATCDIFSTLLLAVAANPSTTTTSTAALEAGYNAVAGSYAPAGTFSIRFRPGSHDAASGYRRLTYQGSCKCFSYVGPTRPLP